MSRRCRCWNRVAWNSLIVEDTAPVLPHYRSRGEPYLLPSCRRFAGKDAVSQLLFEHDKSCHQHQLKYGAMG